MAETDDCVSIWGSMTAQDAERFGRVILDPVERKRWCSAVLLGGLPYLWNQAARPVRDKALEQLDLKPGDRVMLLGEEVEGIGFHHQIRQRIGPTGELTIVDVREQVLAMFLDGKNAQWEYGYTKSYPDDTFDSILVGQAVAHAGDWAREGAELLRAIKPGGALVMAEISVGTLFWKRTEADVHLTYWVEKLMEGIGRDLRDMPYQDMDLVAQVLAGHLEGVGREEWRGCDLFWGRKPRS